MRAIINSKQKPLRLSQITGPLSLYHITAYGDSRGDKEMLAAADITNILAAQNFTNDKIDHLRTLHTSTR